MSAPHVSHCDAPSELEALLAPFITRQAYDEAAAFLGNRLEQNPFDAEAAYQLGELFLEHSNEVDRAVRSFEKALDIAPGYTSARLSLAQAYRVLQQPHLARKQLTLLLEQQPQLSTAYEALGELLEESGYAPEAAEAYQMAIDNDSQSLAVYLRLPLLYEQIEGTDELIITVYRQARERFAEQASLLLFLEGAAHERQQQREKAEACYQQAGAGCDNIGAVHLALAEIFSAQHKPVEAIRHYVEHLALEPTNTDALLALAALLLNEQRPGEALAVLQRARQQAADNTEVLSALAQAYGDLGLAEEALLAYDDLIALRADDSLHWRKVLSLQVVAPSVEAMKTQFERSKLAFKALSKLPLQLQEPVASVGATPYYLAEHAGNLKEPLVDLSQALQQSLQPSPKSINFSVAARPQKTKRIAVFSRYMHPEHWVGQLFTGLFANTSHLGELPIEWVWLTTPSATVDSRLVQAKEASTPLQLLNPQQWQATLQRVLSLGLDALIFPDLGLEPVSYFLSQYRLAPCQVALWSNTVTSGSPHIDALLIPEHAVTESLQEQHSEKLLPLKGVGCYWQPANEPNTKLLREDFAVAHDQHLLVFPFSPGRWHPTLDAFVDQLLRSVPECHLLVQEGAQPIWKQQLQQRLSQTLSFEAMARLHWVGRLRPADQLQLLSLADAVLVPPVWPEPMPVLEALRFGTPMIGWHEDTARSRLPMAFAKACHLSSTYASSAEEALAQAVMLFSNPDTIATSQKQKAKQAVETLIASQQALLAFQESLQKLLA